MNRKLKLIAGILVIASTAFASNGDGKKASYEINTKESKVYWTGKKITGSSHTGHISIGNGMIDTDGESVLSAELNIDLNSIVCTDIENAEYNQKLVGHLKADDFFSVEKYPNAKFEITSVTKNGTAYKVVGNLSMKGQTNEITFPAEISFKGNKITANGTALVDRTKWNIKYGSGSFFKELGDNAIKDEFEIKFELVANSNNVNLSEN